MISLVKKLHILKNRGTDQIKSWLHQKQTGDSDASGFEPIWKNGKRVGFITSGGYGHRVQKSLAMGLINTDLAESGQEIDVHIVGKEKKAKIIPVSPYDPKGELMRA